MLDVHPPHEPLHGWRDFLVHLLTITIGLLIALGLEAIVEHLHHHHQVEHLREALKKERAENQKRFAHDTEFVRVEMAMLKNDLLVLRYCQTHPGAADTSLPGVFLLTTSYQRMDDSAWKTGQAISVTAFMPQDEVQKTAELYSFLERIDRSHEEEADTIVHAVGFMAEDPNVAHLSPAQIDREIDLIEAVLAKHFRHAFLMQNLAEEYPEFTPAPSKQELEDWLHFQAMKDDPRLATPRALTQQRIHEAYPMNAKPVSQ